jgi:putative transposase
MQETAKIFWDQPSIVLEMTAMPRKARLFVDNGYYHITTRGNDRRRVFQREDDYIRMLGITKSYIEKRRVQIFHYCFMPNHLHFILQAERSGDLPKFMQGILQVYAYYFHKRYDSVGYLFQNRYKSIHIEKENYLLECARYIERNPVRAKICDDPIEYPWSSYSFYAEGKENGLVDKPNPYFSNLASNLRDRQRLFRNFVMKEGPYDHIIDKALKIG